MVPYLLSLLLAAAVVASPLDFALTQWSKTSAVEMRDAYKWLFQATLGGEHAAPDLAAARTWLDEEWKTLGAPRPGETAWEPLTADGRIGRVNLRPYRARGGDPQRLAEAFVRSAQRFRATKQDFLTAWAELGARLQKAPSGSLTYVAWQTMDRDARTSDYPAVHHSDGYVRVHAPAYRVLLRDDAVALGLVRSQTSH